jgi:hypothetical protein
MAGAAFGALAMALLAAGSHYDRETTHFVERQRLLDEIQYLKKKLAGE